MKILHVQKMIVMLLGLFPIFLFAEQPPEPPLKAVRYVFLFIGDGMGKAHRAAAEAYALKTTGKGLAINAMPHQAEMTTFAGAPIFTISSKLFPSPVQKVLIMSTPSSFK